MGIQWGTFGRHWNTVAKRDVCQPKYEGGYKRMLHRVSLLAGCNKTGKSFQARGRTNVAYMYRVEEQEMANFKRNLWSYVGT